MRKRLLPLLFALAVPVAAVLILATPLLWAQEPPTRSQTAPDDRATIKAAAAVTSAFTYQGLLEEDGSPVTGSRSMIFSLHASADCLSPVGSSTSLPDVSVEEGLFTVEIAVDPDVIDGQARWLEVQVGGSTIGCQELLPVPYALSLRPGALITGAVGIRVEAGGAGSTAVRGRGEASGLAGSSGAADGAGVRGAGSTGVAGVSSLETGIGVSGYATATTGSPTGVRGETDAVDGYGGYFSNNSFSAVGPDIVLGGDAGNDEGNLWSAPHAASSDMYLRSNDEVWVQLDENNDENAEFRVRNGTNATVFSVDEAGNTFAPGTKSAVVETAAGEYRKVYAIESPVVVFEDFGSAETVDGAVTVEIDRSFAETVNLLVDYQVFLTPVDGWAALYVTDKTATSFEVRDAEGQASIAFDYRLVARREGYEDVRLEAVPAPFVRSHAEADEETH